MATQIQGSKIITEGIENADGDKMGALHLLSTTAGVSNQSTFDVTIDTSTTYDHLLVSVQGMFSNSGGQNPQLRLRTEGGSVRTGASDYAWSVFERPVGVTIDGAGDNSDSFIRYGWYGAGSDTSNGLMEMMWTIWRANNASEHTQLYAYKVGRNSSGNWATSITAAEVLADEKNDMLQFYMESGNITASGAKVYGVLA